MSDIFIEKVPSYQLMDGRNMFTKSYTKFKNSVTKSKLKEPFFPLNVFAHYLTFSLTVLNLSLNRAGHTKGTLSFG